MLLGLKSVHLGPLALHVLCLFVCFAIGMSSKYTITYSLIVQSLIVVLEDREREREKERKGENQKSSFNPPKKQKKPSPILVLTHTRK